MEPTQKETIMPQAKLKIAKDNTPNPPFEFKFISPRLVQFSTRPGDLQILGLDDFKDRYEIVPDPDPTPTPAPTPEPAPTPPAPEPEPQPFQPS